MNLSKPITIRDVEFKNRMLMPFMTGRVWDARYRKKSI